MGGESWGLSQATAAGRECVENQLVGGLDRGFCWEQKPEPGPCRLEAGGGGRGPCLFPPMPLIFQV